jgi:hypothetical protein
MLRAVSLKLKPCNPNSEAVGESLSNNPLAHRPSSRSVEVKRLLAAGEAGRYAASIRGGGCSLSEICVCSVLS